MEPIHIINGRKIYDRVNWKQGLKLTNEWDGTRGTKPLFIDTKGEFWEIEKGGKKYQTAANPEGWTFGNYVKHVLSHNALLHFFTFRWVVVSRHVVQTPTRR